MSTATYPENFPDCGKNAAKNYTPYHSYRCGAGGSCLLCKNEVQDLAVMDCQENGDLELFPGTNKSGPSSLTAEVCKAKRSSLAFLPGLIR